MKNLELNQMERLEGGKLSAQDKCVILCIGAGLLAVATGGMAAGAGGMALAGLGALWC